MKKDKPVTKTIIIKVTHHEPIKQTDVRIEFCEFGVNEVEIKCALYGLMENIIKCMVNYNKCLPPSKRMDEDKMFYMLKKGIDEYYDSIMNKEKLGQNFQATLDSTIKTFH